MKKNFFSLTFLLLTLTQLACAAKEKRTDGPPGSEYGDFSEVKGRLSLGGQFGAIIHNTKSRNSFGLGADVDFRPYDLFGIRLTVNQGVQKPRITNVALTPLAHLEYSNFRPYVFAGPGISMINERDGYGSRVVKFSINLGLGGDFIFAEHYGLGMLWTYDALISSTDANMITARLSYWF